MQPIEPPKARVERVNIASIEGWIACSDGDPFSLVTIRHSGKVLSEAYAQLLRPDVVRIHGTGLGFFIKSPIPISYLPDNASLFLGEHEWQRIKDVPDQRRLTLHIDTQEYFVQGSILAPRGGFSHQTIEAKSASSSTKLIISRIPSQDHLYENFRVAAYSDKDRAQQFSLIIDGAELPQQYHIRCRPLSIRSSAAARGQVDTVGPNFITGWAAPNDDGTASAVSIYCDDELVGTVTAAQEREDVRISHGHERSGFIWPIPKSLRDLKRRTIRVLRAGNELLPGVSNPVVLGSAEVLLSSSADTGLEILVRATRFNGPIAIQVLSDCGLRYNYHAIMQGQNDESMCRIRLTPEECITLIDKVVTINVPNLSLSKVIPRSLFVACLSVLRGNIDSLADRILVGWVAYPAQQSLKVPIEIEVDGAPVATVVCNVQRRDLRTIGISDTAHGFRIELPAKLFDGKSKRVSARCLLSGALVPSKKEEFLFSKIATGNNSRFVPASLKVNENWRSRSVNLDTRAVPGSQALTTIVILSRDGAEVLERCLESIWHFIPVQSIKLIVIDNDSVDSTSDVIERWSSRLSITYRRNCHNSGFSYANNAAAKAVDTEFILFLNNDIILLSDPIPACIYTLTDTTVGAVGIKLIEARENWDPEHPHVHHSGIALFPTRDGYIRPREVHNELGFSELNTQIDVYAVTGAFLFMRLCDFNSIGGFEELYYYGGEDVELGLRLRLQRALRSVCRNDIVALHYRGYLRLTDRGGQIIDRVHQNERNLLARTAYANRKLFLRGLSGEINGMSGRRAVVGFVVREAGIGARSGEYFTALELAKELTKLANCTVEFLTPETGWYNCESLDVLVVMLLEYDVDQIINASPHLIRVAWIRNSFNAWMNERVLASYDLIFSSSMGWALEVHRKLRLNVRHLAIATDVTSMEAGRIDNRFLADVVFNGNFAGTDREFASKVDVTRISGTFKLIGEGWGENASLSSSWVGAADYGQMPDVYASSQIIVDDANPGAREWGGTNSRVFDALAAGTLVLTNSRASSESDFEGLLPVWDTIDDLYNLVDKYLSQPDLRMEAVSRLKRTVLERHTYRHRAREFVSAWQQFAAGPMKISIKVPAPSMVMAAEWGDLYLGMELAAELRARGHHVRLDCIDQWYSRARHVDVCIVLRGLTRYEPMPDQVNVLWVISHPELLSEKECREYDAVLFGSSILHGRHEASCRLSGVLHQFSVFTPEHAARTPENPETIELLRKIDTHDVIFVGNTRGTRREFILGCAALMPLKIIGRGWENYVDPQLIIAESVANRDLPAIYSKPLVVLNDHWPEMAASGLVSNRLYDVACSGGLFVSDFIDEGVKLFGDEFFCRTPNDALDAVERLRKEKGARSKMVRTLSKRVSQHNDIRSRIDFLLDIIFESHARRSQDVWSQV